jgi:hypothetical protein
MQTADQPSRYRPSVDTTTFGVDASAAPLEWHVLGRDGLTASDDTIRRITMDGIAALKQISAADKAKAVPYVKIWRVIRGTNEAAGPELTTQFWDVPKFGSSMGNRFGERPAMSLESVTIKNVNPRGFILYREVDIQIKVHRPDQVFNNLSDNSTALASLMTPGNVHMLTYGWQGGTNSMLSTGIPVYHKDGELHPEEKAMRDRAKASGAKDPVPSKFTAPAKASVRFTVVTYDFSISPDNQIDITIKGFEDGELNVREAALFDQRGMPKPDVAGFAKADDKTKAKAIKDHLQKMVGVLTTKLNHPDFSKDKDVKTDKGAVIKEKFIALKHVMRILFSDPLSMAMTNLGYRHIHFYTGIFNKNAPITVSSYLSQDLQRDPNQQLPELGTGMPIGEFLLKTSDVTKILNDVITTKGQITVYNIIGKLFAIIQNVNLYQKNKKSQIPGSVPEMHLVPIYNPDAAGYVQIWVVDRKRYLTSLDANLNEFLVNSDANKLAYGSGLNVQKKVEGMGVPFISMYDANSFLAGAKFNVVADEMMKSIFIRRNMELNRGQITGENQNTVVTSDGEMDSALLFRSAIKGDLTMIGNFAFNIMGLMWIHFGIRAWDGFFYVMSKTDKIDKSGFTTSITVQAEGSNPAGAPTKTKPTETTQIVASKFGYGAMPATTSSYVWSPSTS